MQEWVKLRHTNPSVGFHSMDNYRANYHKILKFSLYPSPSRNAEVDFSGERILSEKDAAKGLRRRILQWESLAWMISKPTSIEKSDVVPLSFSPRNPEVDVVVAW